MEAPIVDRPGAVGLHVDALVSRLDQVRECPRLPRLDRDVGHPDDRLSIEALRAHAAAGPAEPCSGGGLARGERPLEDTRADDGNRLRGHAFVIPPERAKPAVQGRVGGHVQEVRSEPAGSKVGGLEPARSGVGRFHAEHAIELDRVSDRLVDLEDELIPAQHDCRSRCRARISPEQCDRLLSDPGGVCREVQPEHMLPSRRSCACFAGRI